MLSEVQKPGDEKAIARLREALLKVAGDDDSAVRFEAALPIGTLEGPDKDQAVAKLATFDQEEPWDPLALQFAFGDATWRFLQSQVKARPTLLGRPSVGDERMLDVLGLLIGRRRDAGELTSCIDLLATGADAADPAGPLALAEGLAQGLSESGESLRRLRGDAAQPEALATALTKMDKLLTRAQAVALDEMASRRRRLAALSLLSQAGTAGDPADLLPLLAVDQLPVISAAAADCLARLAEAKLAEQLFAGWTSYSAATRRALAAAALRSPPATEALLAAIEAGSILPLELEAGVRDVLVQLPDAALKERAAKVLAEAIPADRQKVLADYAAALTLSADRRRGGRWPPSTAWPAIRFSAAANASGPTCRASARIPRSSCSSRCWILAGKSRPTFWPTR